MIEPAPKEPTLQQAMEWIVRALRDEGFDVLLGGRSALDFQGEYTGSIGADVLVGTDFRGALSVLDAYVDRGDLNPAGVVPRSVARFLVSGLKPVDVLDVSAVHPRLFDLLWDEASMQVEMGGAGGVRVVTREGYFVLAVMVGLRGFARDKEDPMGKVMDGWEMFGKRTDKDAAERLLEKLGARGVLEEVLRRRR